MKKRDIATITLLWLTVLLVALKLFYFPGLNWGWVFAPLWIPCAVGIIAFFAVVVFFSILKHKKK